MKRSFRTAGLPRFALITLLLYAPAAWSANALPKGIEGVWNVVVDITVCNTDIVILNFDAMAMFERDGTFHDTNATDPAQRSAAFGWWEHVEGRKHRFAFRFFRFDAMGLPLGTTVVRHAVELSRDGDSYVSSGTAEFYDADGNLLEGACSRSDATRFR